MIINGTCACHRRVARQWRDTRLRWPDRICKPLISVTVAQFRTAPTVSRTCGEGHEALGVQQSGIDRFIIFNLFSTIHYEVPQLGGYY